MRKTLDAGFWLSLADRNYSSTLYDLSFFYKCQPIFSKSFKNFHLIFNSPSLSKPFLSCFDKFLNEIIESNGNFSWFIGFLQKNWNIKNKLSKNWEILVKCVQIFEIFLRKMDFSGKKYIDIFEKWIDFLILWILFKNNLRPLPGLPPSPPPDPLRGRQIAFKWPGLPQKNPGDATVPLFETIFLRGGWIQFLTRQKACRPYPSCRMEKCSN